MNELMRDLLLAAALESSGGVIARRDLGSNLVAEVEPLTFGRARLNVGACGAMCYDDGW